MKTLKDKVAIVTGGGSGLGAQITTVLAEEGAIVIPVDVREDAVKKFAEELSLKGYKVEGMKLDVTNEESIKTVFEEVKNKYRRIDIVVNNAGIDFTKSIDDLSIQEFELVTKVNLIGPFMMTKYAFANMSPEEGGHIINISSTAAKRAWSETSAYHATKWGILGFSHASHVEGRNKKIKVSAVIPGGMKTPFILDRFPEAEPNLQDPRNVAETVKFILMQPDETVIPEVMVLPVRETSWP